MDMFQLINNRYQDKLEMCPQYTDALAVGYLTIKLQNSTWNKCLNLSLSMYVRTENLKTICPLRHPMWGLKKYVKFSLK